jgi:DNA-binding transcriptional regulator YiaG
MMTDFKDRLKATKARLNLSNADMAKYLGVPTNTYHQWLNGARVPGSSTMRLLEVLEIIEGWDPALHELLIAQKSPR